MCPRLQQASGQAESGRCVRVSALWNRYGWAAFLRPNPKSAADGRTTQLSALTGAQWGRLQAKAVPCRPPPPLFGREMDQPTVCQGPLSGSPPQSAARIPKTTALEWWIPTGYMRCFTNPGALHRFQNVVAGRQKGTEFPSLCARTGRPTVGKNKTAPSLKGRVPRKKKLGEQGSDGGGGVPLQ